MVLTVLALYDRAAATYGRPFFTASVGVGIRSFTDEVNNANPDNQLYKHPQDFDLYSLGSFDDSSATFQLSQSPQLVARAQDLILSLTPTE